jgi:hypothetical protein
MRERREAQAGTARPRPIELGRQQHASGTLNGAEAE